MLFECTDNDRKWTGKITYFKEYGTHYEIKIESRSGILVLYGKTSQGNFVCIPDFHVGCHLASPRDRFWNTEQLTRVLGNVDGITVANALYTLSDKLTSRSSAV